MKKVFFLSFSFLLVLAFVVSVDAATIAERLNGKILLQIEENGEAWYVNPADNNRYFLGRPADAFQIMRELGLGINESNYSKFNGYAPKNLSGKILLRVEANGEAYYINPTDLKMHYLGRPADAFQVMRELGLGITNSNLESIAKSKNSQSIPIPSPVGSVIPTESNKETVCQTNYYKFGDSCISKGLIDTDVVNDYDVLTVNWSNLDTIHPENIGNNHYQSGTYQLMENDGVGNDEYLIKIKKIDNDNKWGIYTLHFEVFKKESNGHYYYWPSKRNEIFKNGERNINGLILVFNDYEIEDQKASVSLYLDCQDYVDSCLLDLDTRNEESCYICPVSSNPYKSVELSGGYWAKFPNQYSSYTDVYPRILDKCYSGVANLIKVNPDHTYVGLSVLAEDRDSASGADFSFSQIGSTRAYSTLDSDQTKLNDFVTNLDNTPCPEPFSLAHEMTHILTSSYLPENGIFVEGIAEYVTYQLNHDKLFVCLDNGWAIDGQTTIHAYDNTETSQNIYKTGFCFYNKFAQNYGYDKLTELIKQSWLKSRNTQSYYFYDLIVDITDNSSIDQFLADFKIFRSDTYIENCSDCDQIK
ncbi:hypothetical protein HN958_03240 [Candidatus Falkowbacteria bacterium]|jgi:hypothetical protein|nr:hypothetical protein [Candidatus Falkowbacteria bacterium]MBT7007491.1 hypothetical protein [Candidatus Falkowbacteria bacterium]